MSAVDPPPANAVDQIELKPRISTAIGDLANEPGLACAGFSAHQGQTAGSTHGLGESIGEAAKLLSPADQDRRLLGLNGERHGPMHGDSWNRLRDSLQDPIAAILEHELGMVGHELRDQSRAEDLGSPRQVAQSSRDHHRSPEQLAVRLSGDLANGKPGSTYEATASCVREPLQFNRHFQTRRRRVKCSEKAIAPPAIVMTAMLVDEPLSHFPVFLKL